jgi:hypothetical protein
VETSSSWCFAGGISASVELQETNMEKSKAKQAIRESAMSDVARYLKEDLDYREVVERIFNDERYTSLFAGRDADERFDYVYAMIRNCGNVLRYY